MHATLIPGSGLSTHMQVLTGCFILVEAKEWMYTNDSRLLVGQPSFLYDFYFFKVSKDKVT